MADEELVSILTGDQIPEGAAFVTDAEGNHYLAEEYSIEVDLTEN